MGAFKNAAGKPVLMRMVKGIQDNKAYLGEVDGLIGDGDHGMNMNKGFSVFEERFKDEDISFSEGLDELGMILLNEIGGYMGPIYGTIFMDMAEAGEDLDEITAADLGTMLEAGLNGLYGIVDAKVGDKTLESSRSRRKRFQRSTGRDEESCRSRTRFYQGHGSKIRTFQPSGREIQRRAGCRSNLLLHYPQRNGGRNQRTIIKQG